MWEYTTVQLVATGFDDPAQTEHYQKVLAEFGVERWELVSAVGYNSTLIAGQIIVLFFKRSLPAGGEQTPAG
ncbi:MAG: DUF4177 domain-containing protein [Gemmataceae bacterium]